MKKNVALKSCLSEGILIKCATFHFFGLHSGPYKTTTEPTILENRISLVIKSSIRGQERVIHPALPLVVSKKNNE